MKIQEIFPNGQFISSEEYLITCPFCGDKASHHHCYVNIRKGVFFCQFCNEKGNVRKLFEVTGEDIRIVIEPEKVEIKKRELIDFVHFPPVLGEVNMVDKWALLYLEERGITRKEIHDYDIRYATWGKWDNRIIFPVYEDEKVVCWAARALFEDMDPKYLYPSRGESLRTASEVLFSAFDGPFEYIVLVEGIFDAIGLARKIPKNFKSVSLLGKNVSWFQRKMLLEMKVQTIFIMLDADASGDIVKIARDLSGWGKEVFMCFLEKGDPDSASGEEVAKALLDSIRYNFNFEIERKCMISRK